MLMLRNISSHVLDYFFSSVGDNVYMMTPIQYMLALARVFTDVLMDRMVLVITSFIMGMLAVVVVEIFFFWNYFIQAPVLPPPKFTATPVTLPQAMKTILDQGSIKQKEDCVWLNLLLNFLFSELRDTLALRRFFTKKIQIEFEEVLRSKSGVLVDELFLRDFHLGNKLPVITSMSVDRCDVSHDVIQTLDLKLHVVYDGGFQIGIDAALPFHRRAFVSVTVVKLKGLVRLQFSQLPFSHWNVSFYEEPELELDVTAQLDGRPMPKLRSIIANQIRKIIRRKHTLPMYKMRYKPIFQPRPQFQPPGDTHIQINGANICSGVLEVTVIEANRLPFVVKGSKVYSTVSVDELPWKEQMLKERKKKKIITAELVKNSTDQSLGMMVMDELLPDRLHPVVIIGEVSVGSPAHMANIKQGDILVAVGENKVTSAKQAMKSLKSTKDKIQIHVERSGAEIQTKDELVCPRQASSWHEGQTSERRGQTADSHSSHTTSQTDSPKQRSKMQHKCHYQVPESRRTTLKESSTNPHWDHKFIFTVNSSMNFLNVCLWSTGGDRTGKSELISSTKQDVLIGYVSLRLEEIYLHCLITLSGTLQDKVKLRHGHYKTEEELVKKWSVHKGWEPNEMYGQLLLGFHYVPTELSAAQRQALSGSKQSSARLHKELSESYPTTQEGEQFKPSPTKVVEEFRRDPNEGHHQFDSTTFMTATFCDYCGKKIWMKEAFKCQTCSMVCHKKCLVKCLLNTVCTEAGAKKRSSSDEAWEPLKGTSKIRRSEVMDETVRHPGAQEEDWSSQDVQSGKEVNIVDSSESLQNLANLLNADQEHRAGPYIMKKTENAPEVNQGTRFRLLKEQTDRMKDNVLKHLGKSKVPATFNDKAIMSAKELGARLYIDMDPTLRKDKLEELVKKLDEELKTEMENKESLEQELIMLEEQEQKSETSKRSKSEMKALHSKIFKSVEKQDTMRLLMLQYCSGLQNCINSLEAQAQQAGSSINSLEVQAGSSLQTSQSESSRTSRTAAVGGFVRRASSSVKEKMSFIKKDFGKRGSREDQASTSRGNNNNGLSVIEESEDVSVQDRTDESRRETSSKSAAEDDIQDLITLSGIEILNEVLALAEDAPPPSSHPTIDIQVDEVDVEPPDQSEPSVVTRDQSALTRSSSDSSLELSKMMNLRPEDILRYRGSSLPTLPPSDETDSDSDFLVIDSSDEPAMTDSSDSDSNHETVAFEGKKKKKKHGRDEGDGQHRITAQHIHTYKV